MMDEDLDYYYNKNEEAELFQPEDFYEEPLTTIQGQEAMEEFKVGGSSLMKQIMISGRDSFISEEEEVPRRIKSQLDIHKNQTVTMPTKANEE